MKKNYNVDTICVQGGYNPKNGDPRILPIVQSTTYKYEDPDFLADLFDLKEEGHMYTRISNPTVEAFENKITSLEGGVGAVAVASGQSATTLALLNLCSCGDHILASLTLYGGTITLLSSTFKKFGIEVTFVSPKASIEEISSEIKDNTKVIFAETISNPNLDVLDFEKFAAIAQGAQIPLVIDNTLATPYLCRPFEHGANIVIHSATKYIDGHATSVGGIIIDGGNFDWCSGKFPQFTEPDITYHGVKYVESFKEKAYITSLRVKHLRDIGTSLSPFNAFLFNLNAETLHLRMERHSSNALGLGEFLENHPKVSWVKYPLLKSHTDYELAKEYIPRGAGGILSFGITGGKEAAVDFMRKIELTKLVIHLGDARTSVLHPATTTHRQLSEEDQIKSGVTPELIRVSVGIEHIDDIISDFEKALS